MVNSIATTGQLPDFAEINAIALSAQNISQQAVDTVSTMIVLCNHACCNLQVAVSVKCAASCDLRIPALQHCVNCTRYHFS